LIRAQTTVEGKDLILSPRSSTAPTKARFPQLLEEIEHFCGCGQYKVAKIVQCGEPEILVNKKEATCEGGLKFCDVLARHN